MMIMIVIIIERLLEFSPCFSKSFWFFANSIARSSSRDLSALSAILLAKAMLATTLRF